MRNVGITKLYYSYRAHEAFIRKDIASGFPAPILKKLYWWFHGFMSEKPILYKMTPRNKKLFLSDRDAYLSRNVNQPFNEILTNKYIFSQVVKGAVSTPRIFGLILRGEFTCEAGDDFFNLLQEKKRLVIKPVVGGGGKGVLIISADEGRGLRVNGRAVSSSELGAIISSLNDCIVSEFAEQGAFARSLNSSTVNTMRVVTIRDPDSGCYFIAQAVQRIGVATSQPMDNFSKGGLSANIDLETGQLSSAMSHPKDLGHTRLKFHPDTQVAIEGQVIPNWSELKDVIVSLATSLPMLKYIGWDLLLTDDGLIAIEGNHHPDPDVLQCHGPLLRDERVAAFFQSEGF